MDPNANLAEQCEIASRILKAGDLDDADRLAELVCALDSWLRVGGALPERWQPGQIHRQLIEDASK